MNPLPASQAAADLEIRPLDDSVRADVEAAASASPELVAQHHPVWADILAACGEKMLAAVALRGTRVAGWMMGAVREAEAGVALTSLPYVAYGGPALPAPDPEARAALLGWFSASAERVGAGAISLGMSPFSAGREVDEVAVALGDDEAAFRFDNFAQVQALDPHPLAQLPKSRRDKLASSIRRAEREGVVVSPCDDLDTFHEWLAIYRGRYDQIGARPLPDRFHIEAFTAGRKAGVVEFWIASHEGRLLGGTLFLVGRGSVDYFSSAFLTDEQARALSPNNLLLSRVFDSFAERGQTWFNWQSSPGREGVYRFKAGWGAEERSQVYVGRIMPGRAGQRITAATPAEIHESFPGRFVLPFSRLQSG